MQNSALKKTVSVLAAAAVFFGFLFGSVVTGRADLTLGGNDPGFTAVTSFNSTVDPLMTGDLNGDGFTTVDDVTYLMYHFSFPDLYPVSAPADFSQNGTLDYLDVLKLLYCIFFPETYNTKDSVMFIENDPEFGMLF